MRRELLITAMSAVVLTVAGCAGSRSERTVGQSDERRYESGDEQYAGLVGPRGADGPAGPAGEQGPSGPTGESGTVFAGPRGLDGAAGPAGERGLTGDTGLEGAVVVGRAGPAGRPGPAGPQGAAGPAGKQGASTEGYAGAAGAAGPQGPRGETGATGARGTTLVGPTGPAGRSGAEGEVGAAGEAGARGQTSEGVAGATGRTGTAGERGAAGQAGEQGPAGVVDRWTSYREVWFKGDAIELDDAQTATVSDVAKYLKQNPSLQVGIDASQKTTESNRQRGQRLVDDRVAAISDALIEAGVPESRIKAGSFGDPDLRRDGRVSVLISTREERAQADR